MATATSGRASAGAGAAPGAARHGDSPLVRVLKRWYEPLLRASVRRRGTVLAGAGALTAERELLGTPPMRHTQWQPNRCNNQVPLSDEERAEGEEDNDEGEGRISRVACSHRS